MQAAVSFSNCGASEATMIRAGLFLQILFYFVLRYDVPALEIADAGIAVNCRPLRLPRADRAVFVGRPQLLHSRLDERSQLRQLPVLCERLFAAHRF